jgi:hypothetical protein
MLRDASGRSVTNPKRLIRKRPLASGSGASLCQVGCRGFDPRFPLQLDFLVTRYLRLVRSSGSERSAGGEFKKEFKAFRGHRLFDGFGCLANPAAYNVAQPPEASSSLRGSAALGRKLSRSRSWRGDRGTQNADQRDPEAFGREKAIGGGNENS